MPRIKKVKPTEIEGLKEKLVMINRTAKVVKGGKRIRFSAIVVVGDKNGHVGIGLGKGREVTDAIQKASENAKKNIVEVPIVNGTVPHEIVAKFGASKVLIKPAAPGTGIIAGGAVRAVLELAGVQNVLTKCFGSTNPHNTVKATLKALTSMIDARTMAAKRGMTLKELFESDSLVKNLTLDSKMAKKLKITQVRSIIGTPEKQRRTIKALGLGKPHKTVIHYDTPVIRGMINKVKHLVVVEEIENGGENA
ncbi:SSU ribosomal protein S5P [Candidatus Kryptobacter tengchongensis]|uniref:Small ribosomal subunit protein uS5 n=2 Tax=Kryptobacter tengchongensis TaxID=1643429 RepID=A0A656D3L4_KRYT1|nr:SSU ribosomal protein S5P [Candidatus Kryptobacter tengchongensis]